MGFPNEQQFHSVGVFDAIDDAHFYPEAPMQAPRTPVVDFDQKGKPMHPQTRTDRVLQSEGTLDVDQRETDLNQGQRMQNPKLHALRIANPFVPIVPFPNSVITAFFSAAGG